MTVNPNTATQGAYTKVSFRVPTESDTLSTTKVEVNLPTDTPTASVSLKPLSGWTAATVKSKLATPIKTDDGLLATTSGHVADVVSLACAMICWRRLIKWTDQRSR